MKLFPYRWYLSFWFSWAVVTAIYLFNFFGLQILNSETLWIIFGLFVPIGVFSAVFTLPTGLGVLVIFLLGADKIAWFLGMQRGVFKIVYNLYALLLCTLIVESWLLGGWPSVIAFQFKEGIPSHPYPLAEGIIILVGISILVTAVFKNFKKEPKKY